MMKKLKNNLIELAYNNIPQYNHRINQMLEEKGLCDVNNIAFEDLPPYSKEDIKKWGIVNMLSIDVNRTKTVIQRTSGTTGEPMDIVWSHNDYISSLSTHWIYRYIRFNITPDDRCFVTEQGSIENGYSYIREGNQLVFNSSIVSQDSCNHIIKEIMEFKPKWMLCQLSVLFSILHLTSHDVKENMQFLRGIEFMSEPNVEYYKKAIEAVFPNVPMINMYGCTETNGIAYTCPQNHMHLMENNVFVEVLDKNDLPLPYGLDGNVCVTGLHNTIMPFIRYKLDDIGKIEKFECSCGNKSPIITLKQSRLSEILLFDNPNIYSGGSIYYPIKRLKNIKPTERDIVFKIFRFNLGDYVVGINNTLGYSTKIIEETFHSILNEYGITGINLRFIYDNIRKGGIEGILRIHEEKS